MNDLPLSHRTNMATGVLDARRLNRTGSFKADSVVNVTPSPVSMASERNQRMHERLDRYINDYPTNLSDALKMSGTEKRKGSKGQDEIEPNAPSNMTTPTEQGKKRWSVSTLKEGPASPVEAPTRRLSFAKDTNLPAKDSPKRRPSVSKASMAPVKEASSKRSSIIKVPSREQNPSIEEEDEKQGKWKRRSRTFTDFVRRKSYAG
jgi:hypothetical protein